MTSLPENPTISAIIPVHDGGMNFRRCLSAFVKASPPPDEIIVVVDGNAETPRRMAEEFGATVLTTPFPGGPARARNLGAYEARGDILFFVDADVTICPDAGKRVVSCFAEEPDLAAVFGSYDDAPDAGNFLSQYKNLFHHYTHQTANAEASTFWSACGAIRRDVFLALGGFDEHYREPSIEDIELGYRLTQAGYRTRLCKALQAKHLKRWNVVSLLKSDFLHRALPWTELILRDRHLINDLNLQRSSRLSIVLAYGSLGALVGAWNNWAGSFILAGALVLSLLILNAPVYRFFWEKRGLRFTLQAIPWHWLYYLYSGLAFGIGTLRYFLRPNALSKTGLPTPTD